MFLANLFFISGGGRHVPRFFSYPKAASFEPWSMFTIPKSSRSLGFFKLLFTACWPLVQKREAGQCCSQDVCWQVLGDSRLSPIEIEEQHFTPTLPLVVGVCVVDDIYP